MPDEVVTPLVDESALPPELRGKTTVEIQQYYARREQILADQVDRLQRIPPKKEDPPIKPNEMKFDIFNDAEASVERKVNERVNEALTNATNVIGPGVIAGCKLAMANAHPKDWSRFAAEVDKRMKGFTADGQMNPEFWESTYKLVKGEMADTLVAEAETRTKNPVERPTPVGDAPAKPRELSERERTIATKFGMSNEQYVNAAKRLDTDENGRSWGDLPFTLDSERTAKKAS